MSAADSQIMNYLVRMVVPMRREFGRNLDVQHFLHDHTYAREVLQHARHSRDQRLRDYAAYVERALGRDDEDPAAAAGSGPAAATVPPDEPLQTAPPEDVLRAVMLKKYTGGLR
jgi:hypothetical protein